ncbi:MAG: T9SS type A sorting domain-containing protein [Ignavibacteriaceae bacterium]|nr:T9SS type A sorting domain-containing protein [Ignavibacteriaceae bacterium]
MKTNIILWLLFSCVIISFAQNRVVLKPSGEIITVSEKTTSHNLKNEKTDKRGKNTNTSSQSLKTKSVDAWLDTLTYFRDYTPNTNFGIFGQDWLLQWFIAPSDMFIHKAGISFADVPTTHVEVEVKLVKLKWGKSELQKNREINLGYYVAEGNGYNNITAFQDNPDRTGDWVDSSDLGLSSPFAEDVWSDSGVGMVVYPKVKTEEQNYQWVDLDILGKDVIVKSHEIIGVAVRNLNSEMDSMRVGISAGSVSGYTGFKFYSNGRLQPGIDFGWWSRLYTFDFALEIELLEGGCWPFRGNAVSYVPTTFSAVPREVSAIVNHCGLEDIGKSKVELNYSFDKGITYAKAEMTTTDADSLVQTFKGWIPDAGCGVTVIYYASYINAAGVSFESESLSYYTRLCNAKNPSLIVFNGFNKTTGFPPSYYFGFNGTTTDSSEIINFPKDTWAYGPLTKELVDNYSNIFEITTTGPKANNNQVIKDWLAASPKHNYFLAGDEYFGTITSWFYPNFYAGDFQFDILGISKCYNDINYSSSGDEKKASLVTAIAGTELADSLYLKVVTLNEDSLKIDPTFVLGTSYSNWLDGFDPAPVTIVDLTAKGINGNDYSIGAHRTLPAGNKIAFLAFDPLSLDSPPSNYFWYGFDRVSPLVQAMRWFGADVVEVEDDVSSPLYFQLNQNYPNPFNPSTVISWQLAVRSFVTLKVYDILGNEVATLVNEEKPAGNYKTDFNGNNLASGISSKGGYASGVYFYTLRAGSFVQSRKMILLK